MINKLIEHLHNSNLYNLIMGAIFLSIAFGVFGETSYHFKFTTDVIETTHTEINTIITTTIDSTPTTIRLSPRECFLVASIFSFILSTIGTIISVVRTQREINRLLRELDQK